MTYGASITRLCCLDKNGTLDDIILGFENLEGYLQTDNPYMNCIVGRVANRIANAQYKHNGETIKINSHNADYVLHGGINGFNKKIWTVLSHDECSISLSYKSVDGEEGFPGNLDVEVKYSLTDEDELHIVYTAMTDKACPVNLTSHCYFNLGGGSEEDVLDHELLVVSDKLTTVDENSIPTGDFTAVLDTPYDLNTKKLIANQFKNIAGYDENWVVGDKTDIPKFCACLSHSKSGRALEVYTTEPGIQVYTSNSFDGNLQNTKGGKIYKKHAGICLETQLFPDSPNHPHFPNSILEVGKQYRQHTIYKMKRDI